MKKIKEFKLGDWILLLLVSYVMAYTLLQGYHNFQIKNEYEKAKIESYYKLSESNRK